MKSNPKKREGRSKAKSTAVSAKTQSAGSGKTKAGAKPRAKSTATAQTKSKPASRAKSTKAAPRGGSKPAKAAAKVKAKTKPVRKAKKELPATAKPKAGSRARSKTKPKLEPTVQIKIQDQEELARVGAHVDQATIDSATANLNPGPRMQQILQATIGPWRRDSVSDEEAQLRELNRIPVRHVFDSDEARRRLVDRAATPGKKRFARSKATSTSSS